MDSFAEFLLDFDRSFLRSKSFTDDNLNIKLSFSFFKTANDNFLDHDNLDIDFRRLAENFQSIKY